MLLLCIEIVYMYGVEDAETGSSGSSARGVADFSGWITVGISQLLHLCE